MPFSPGLAVFGYPKNTEEKYSTATRCVVLWRMKKRTQPPCGWESNQNLLPRVAEAATLGWRAQPRCGSPLNERLVSNLTQVHQASTYKEFIFLPRTQLPAHS